MSGDIAVPPPRPRKAPPPLDLMHPPIVADVMIDKLVVRFSGEVLAHAPDISLDEVFTRYAHVLTTRAGRSTVWRSPRMRSKDDLTVDLKADRPTLVDEASINVRWRRSGVTFSVSATLNPSRALVHRLQNLPTANAGSFLSGMNHREFFACEVIPRSQRALDGNDNALWDLWSLQANFGADRFGDFIGIFESQLRKWAMEAVAPHSEGFSAVESDGHSQASNGSVAVKFDWSQLCVQSAEAYFERTLLAARPAMNRFASRVTGSHTDVGWRKYSETETGGRRRGSSVVGLKLTNTIQLAAYAKFPNRIRFEVRYSKAVANGVRATRCNGDMPLMDMLSAVREDALKRTSARWGTICNMLAPPTQSTLEDAVGLIASIARHAFEQRVPPLRLLEELIGGGGIDETGDNGDAPRRLIDKLLSAGIITRYNLSSRRRPGEQARYRLSNEYHDIAIAMQSAFNGLSDP